MVSKKKDSGLEERLDRLGVEIVRASAANEAEAEQVASSPFLYTRLRSRIAAERERREAGGVEGWLAMLGLAWRTVPAMALVAIFAFALFWSVNLSTPTSVALSDDALLGTSGAEIERVVFADRQPLSSDEVLATIINEDVTEASR
jgi:hypothetical protein